MNLEGLFEEHIGFSVATFSDCSPQDSINHLKEELDEVLDSNCEDVVEYVDCFMCLLSSMKKAGFTMEQFKEAFRNKLINNQTRSWEKNKMGYYSHKR